MTNLDELKPVKCGCGGEAQILHPSFTNCIVVMCGKCRIKTPYMNSEAEAVIAWNRAMSGATDTNVGDKERTAKVESDGNFIRSEKMTNLISKSMTIEAVLDLLKQMPEIEPEERKAKVSKGAYDLMRCECGMPVSSNFDYCPGCGCRLIWRED